MTCCLSKEISDFFSCSWLKLYLLFAEFLSCFHGRVFSIKTRSFTFLCWTTECLLVKTKMCFLNFFVFHAPTGSFSSLPVVPISNIYSTKAYTKLRILFCGVNSSHPQFVVALEMNEWMSLMIMILWCKLNYESKKDETFHLTTISLFRERRKNKVSVTRLSSLIFLSREILFLCVKLERKWIFMKAIELLKTLKLVIVWLAFL